MKKIVAGALIAALALGFIPTSQAANQEKGGFMGFIAGCCFGMRSGAAYNDGKSLHWREWGLLIPFAGWVVAIMNGIDGSNGITNADLAAQYGSVYY